MGVAKFSFGTPSVTHCWTNMVYQLLLHSKRNIEMKVYNFREAEKIIIKNGFQFISQNGSHKKYKKETEIIIIKNKLNRMIFQRLIKEHNLILS